jgi:vacuolar-type H+-ATPase subunit H
MDTSFYRRLAEHAGLPFIDEPDAAHGTPLSPAAARAFGVAPVLDDGRTLSVVTADPARVDVPGLAALTDRLVQLAVSSPEAVEHAQSSLDDEPSAEPAPVGIPESSGPAQDAPAAADLVSVPMPETSFKRSFRGYNRSQVDAAISSAREDADRLRGLHARLDALREREAQATRALDELRERREQMERDARTQAQQLVLEAQERATLLKSEGIRQVGELQAQVEQLIGMRAGLTQAMQRLSEDIAAAMARIASAPATAIDRPVEHHLERWSEQR